MTLLIFFNGTHTSVRNCNILKIKIIERHFHSSSNIYGVKLKTQVYVLILHNAHLAFPFPKLYEQNFNYKYILLSKSDKNLF